MLNAFLTQLLLTGRLFFDRRVSLLAKLVMLFPIVYILSPIDVIPDVLIGLGQLDDLGMLLAGMQIFQRMAPNHVVQYHLERIANRRKISGREEPDIVDAPYYTVHEDDQPQRDS
ncbi:MAG: DUF1232 domain-containing protein [Chloroflexi bacterium]|nr:DUF1232 domain-containing protein [Chloroflexota bacterium]